MRQWFRALILPVVVCLPPVAFADARVLDRSVAMVNGQVMTWSELDFEARVLLIYAGGTEARSAPLDFHVLRDSRDELITHRLLARAAEALVAYPLDEGELEAAVKRFKMRFETQATWQAFLDRHETDETGVTLTLARFLRAQHVLDGKLRLKAQVSESEAKRWVEEHPELAELPLTAVRQKLFADRFRSLAKGEVRQARKNARVRLLGPFAGGADGGAS
ncbi:MAG: hypothetical protein JNK82_29180 [Myxococcaceae bacterium]|nr:hypothetical protein [Myxococcaceae bacterium]